MRRTISRLANHIENVQFLIGNVFRGALISSFSILSPLAANAVAAFSAIGAAAGVAGGGILGLASSVGAAAGGLGIFAPFAISAFNSLNAMEKAAAEGSDAYKKHGSAVIGAVEALGKLKDEYSEMNQRLRDPMMRMFTEWIQAARIALARVEPIVLNVTKAIGKLGTSLQKNLKAPDVEGLFSWLETAAPRAITNLTKMVGNFAVGLGNLLKAFDPLAQTMEQGLLRMSQRWREWTAEIDGSNGLKTFIQYVQQNGPKLISIVANITMAFVGIFKAFAPMSADMIGGLDDLTQKFKTWASQFGQTLCSEENEEGDEYDYEFLSAECHVLTEPC